MPRQAGTFVENSFVKGLITEATGLNFPEQAVTSTDNCVFDERGNVRRRRGIDFEPGFFLREDTREDCVVTSYRWDAAAGDGNNSLVVTQVGPTLDFYLTDSGAVSDSLVDSLTLTPYATSTAEDLRQNECQFTAGKGYLFVAHPYMESIFVTYDSDTQQVAATQIDVTIRDFKGVDDGLTLQERPTVLTDAHEYNLHNQGWDTAQEIDLSGGSAGFPLTAWDTSEADFPSNVDVWWRFAGSGFDPTEGRDFGNTPASKGHFILNYYDQDPNSVQPADTGRSWSGLTVIANSASARASTIEFFAGRVWFAGTKGAGYSNEILFSQIIERDEQIGFCYQLNDPTAEVNFDLLPSDGGVILIPDSGTILKLFAYEDSILVFSTNGCWKISGSQGVGFRANDYSVVKVSSIPCLTASSFVSIAGVPSFWNSEGIYLINADQTLGTTSVTSITDTTIRSFYNDIPLQSKKDVKGAYNRTTRVVSWVYKSTEGADITERYSFDRVLNLNTLSSAFYGWAVNISNVALNGVVVPMSRESIGEPEAVLDGLGAPVLDGLGNQVYSFGTTHKEADVTKFLVSYEDGATYQITFADEWNEGYEDWFSFDSTGTNYDSYFVTGYKVHGEGQRKAQPTYVNLFFSTADYDSAIDFRSIWQYANTGSTGRFSSAQRITTTSNLYDFTRRRVKTRGSGISYQFRVDSVDGEPFYLIGWSVFETANAGL